MSKNRLSTHRRKLAAGALVVIAGLGLSFASASQLNLAAPASVQSGAVTVAADCQPSAQTISVAFAAPTLSSGSYRSQSVTFGNIHADCATRAFKVSFLDASNNALAAESTGSVTAPSLTVTIPAGVSQNDIVRIAMTIF